MYLFQIKKAKATSICLIYILLYRSRNTKDIKLILTEQCYTKPLAVSQLPSVASLRVVEPTKMEWKPSYLLSCL